MPRPAPKLLTTVTAPLLAIMAMGSCANETGTCQLATDALVMWANVSDADGEVVVDVEFETSTDDGDGTSLELCPNRDVLKINGEEATLVRAFGQYYYEASFASPLASVELELARTQFESVVASIELPPSFEITAPAAGSSHSRAADLEITWDPSWAGHEIQVSIVDGIGSSCIDGLGYGRLGEDNGTHVVAAGDLQDGGAGAECQVTLLMSRELIGEYPAALHEGGQFSAYVRRFHSLISRE